MKLVVIRHGIAEEREAFAPTGLGDALRPLTEKGRKRLKRAVRGLQRLVPAIDLMASSRLLRATQTAEIIAERYPSLEAMEIDELSPEATPESLLDWLRTQATREVVAIVGHEGGLSLFVSWLLTGRKQSHLVLSKGGICMVDLADEVLPQYGKLRWLLTPRQLRAIGR